MTLRCLLFSSDGGTAAPILQVLTGLGVAGELCSEAVTTVEKVTHQSFQIVIIDWDKQPEAGLLLTAARERKAAERPLTLAIVSNDISVPQALQAGANSILRKPILVSQVKDTLTTARDLLRSKQESAANAAQAAAAGASAGSAATIPESAKERTLRAGEFLQSAGTAPGGQFETDSDVHESLHPSSVEPVDLLKDLEPMAGSVAELESTPAAPPPPPPAPGEIRGLEWFLKTRAASQPPGPAPAPPEPPAPAKLELLGFDQTPAQTPRPPKNWDDVARAAAPAPEAQPNPPSPQEEKHEPRPAPKHEPRPDEKHEQKKEAELFAYISGERGDSEETARPRFRHKGAIIAALVLASGAILAAPQAPWHPKISAAWARGRQTVHAWLNPQLVTTPQAPAAHEDFGRAGDEYKLPVAENIPDATTDPSQIQVLPVVDPTIKKPNSLGANAEQPQAGDPSGATPTDQTPASGAQSPASTDATQPVSEPPAGGTSGSPVSTASPVPAVVVPPATTVPPHSDTPAGVPQVASPVASVPAQPAPQKNPQPHYATPPGNVPSSLKSQMASMTPDASGNKAPEAAMRSIEPVAVPEAEERALLTDQPALAYPASAGGQQGTVVLQVLIGRDGTVQDAKFLQGSLAFARAAIDGVKLWKFKPYAMNGRPVSVQTTLTISFKPAP
jgi:periplasmic protein TonB